MGIDWSVGPTRHQLEEMLERMRQRRADAKAAERGFSYPGLDAIWFAPTPPLRVWHAYGLPCGLAAGFTGVNGYVWLPEGHPWRALDLQSGDDDDAHGVPLPEVHGGVTFGPHVTGWIGFDTGHAFDVWTRQEQDALWEVVPERVRESWAYMRSVEDREGLRMPGSPGASGRPEWDTYWTVDLVVAETEELAAQAAAVTS